jgi:opine dehydrogenase
VSATVAVVGAGNGGQAMAAEMAMRGHSVRLYEDPVFEAGIAGLRERPEIELLGGVISGRARLEKVTTALSDAITGAECVFLPVPAFAHSGLADDLAPLLRDGQIVVLYPGTFGTLLFRERMARAGVHPDVLLCETHTLPYDCRLEGPGRVRVLWKNQPMLLGVFPARRTQEALDRLGDRFYEFRAQTDVLETGLCSVNATLHLPACIMNTGRIERSRGEFWLYEEGFTPTVCRVTERVDAERVALARAWGYGVPTLVEELAEDKPPRDLFYEINGALDLVVIKGPSSVTSRYFTEDVPFALVPWVQLGDVVGFETPLLDALLALGAAIIDQKPLQTGRTLASLGLAGMGVERMRDFVRTGR